MFFSLSFLMFFFFHFIFIFILFLFYFYFAFIQLQSLKKNHFFCFLVPIPLQPRTLNFSFFCLFFAFF